MELCTGGSLVSRIRSHRNGFNERAAATLVEKMLSAILYCHRHGVVHRDIKHGSLRLKPVRRVCGCVRSTMNQRVSRLIALPRCPGLGRRALQAR